MNSPDKVLSKLSLDELRTVIVYAWVRGDEWLYVGMSTHGLARVLVHGVIGKKEALLPEDRILCWNQKDESAARVVERNLIFETCPKYNLDGLPERVKKQRGLLHKYRSSRSFEKETRERRACKKCGALFYPTRTKREFCQASCERSFYFLERQEKGRTAAEIRRTVRREAQMRTLSELHAYLSTTAPNCQIAMAE